MKKLLPSLGAIAVTLCLFTAPTVSFARGWELADVCSDSSGEWLMFDDFETRLLQSWWDYGPALDAWNGDRVATTDLARPVAAHEDEPLRFYKQSVEYRFDDNIMRTKRVAHSGQWSLQVRSLDLPEGGAGANVTVSLKNTLFWLNMRPESRIRFWFRGDGKSSDAKLELLASWKEDGKQVLHSLGDATISGQHWTQFVSKPLGADAAGATELVVRFTGARSARHFHIDDFEISNCLPTAPTPVEISTEVDSREPRPILVGFRGRQRSQKPTLLFSDLTGWALRAGGGWKASICSSREEPLFEDTPLVGKLTYSGNGSGWVEIRPARPPIIRSEVDAVKLWVYGQRWAWVDDASTPFAGFLAEITDSSGARHYIDMNRYMAKFWNLLMARIIPGRHRVVGGDGTRKLTLPARLTALIVYGDAPSEPRSLYLDSLTVCKDQAALPEPAETTLDLPVPTTPDTFLPAVTRPVLNSLRHEGKTTEFIALGEDETITYRYCPKSSGLSDLTAVLPSGRTIKPCDGAGPGAWFGEQRVGPQSSGVRVSLLKHTQDDSGVSTRWRWSEGKHVYEFTMTLRLKGKTLVVDWTSHKGDTSAFIVGTIRGLELPRLISVPHMTWGHPIQTPSKVVFADGEFMFTHLDLHNTNASAFSAYSAAGRDWAVCNGDASYFPDSSRKTAPLRERQFITISRDFEEVLPSIPNPPSPFKDTLSQGIYWHGGGAKYMEDYIKMLRGWKSLGVDSVFFSLHEAMWTEYDTVCQGPQAFSFTTDLSEEIDRNRFIEITSEIRKMGYHMGPYYNSGDLSPLGSSFDERRLSRTAQMQPMASWPPCWGIKPSQASVLADWFLPAIVRDFNLNNAYMDCLTAWAPWKWVDSDSRLEGASQLSTNYRNYCSFALKSRKYINGPIFSEGTFHWMYAGLHEGSYGWHAQPYDDVLLVDFRLRRINPLMSGMAAGPVPRSDAPAPLPAVAGTILWGNIASAIDGPAELMYYLCVPLQKHYVMEVVDKIRYGKNGELFDTSEAIANGAVNDNQVIVSYRNGLELAFNGNLTKNWLVRLGGQDYDLPPGGWAARKGDQLESYAIKRAGAWLATTVCKDWEIVVPYGQSQEFGSVFSSMPLVMRYDDPRGTKVIPVGNSSEFTLKQKPGKIMAYAAGDQPLGEVACEPDGRGWLVKCDGTWSYLILTGANGKYP